MESGYRARHMFARCDWETIEIGSQAVRSKRARMRIGIQQVRFKVTDAVAINHIIALSEDYKGSGCGRAQLSKLARNRALTIFPPDVATANSRGAATTN